MTDTHVRHREEEDQGGDMLPGTEADNEVGDGGRQEGMHPLGRKGQEGKG